jgi:hypothetical protein
MEGWIMTDIRTSALGGVPFGTSLTRPANPDIGQTYYNGTLGVQEIYTSSGWLPATGANDFNVTLSGTVTTATFTKEYFAGAYTIASALLDSTYDIYVYDSVGNQVGYTKSPSLTATGNFNKIVIIGGTQGDLLSFSYKTTFTSSNTTAEVTAGAFITSVTPTALNSIDDTTVITGGNFASNVAVYFMGSDNIERAAKSVVRSSSSSLIVTRPDSFPTSLGTYKVIVENPGITRPTGSSLHILNNAITAGTTPNWTTGTTLPEPLIGSAYSTTLVATDTEGTDIDYSIISGSLPSGFSLNEETGVITATSPTAFANTTFTIRAVDTGGNTVDRAFNIVCDVPVWVTDSTIRVGSGAQNIQLQATDSNTLTYSLTSGSLPSGLSLSSTGLITGTASSSGISTVTIRATDSVGNFTNKVFTIDVFLIPSGASWVYLSENLSSDASTWTDTSGNNRTLTINGSGKSKISAPATNGSSQINSALQMSATTSNFTLPSSALSNADNWTFIHIARYNGGARGRIFDGLNANWLSGFYNSSSGIAYQEGWISEANQHSDNWVLSSNRHNHYRSNRVTRGTSGAGSYNVSAIKVNDNQYGQNTDANIIAMLFWSRRLSDAEVQQVENTLAAKYGIG